jgi:hypothetical protein
MKIRISLETAKTIFFLCASIVMLLLAYRLLVGEFDLHPKKPTYSQDY